MNALLVGRLDFRDSSRRRWPHHIRMRTFKTYVSEGRSHSRCISDCSFAKSFLLPPATPRKSHLAATISP